ncbi:MAG: 2-amino-4-hydroxy-6-hydroxymethyldihydropteridine diphosphokinase [Pelagibacteraceae bacterium]
MVYLAFGSNLSSKFGNSIFTIKKAYAELEKCGVKILKKSSFYRSKAYPDPKDPEFINSVVQAKANINPNNLIKIIFKIEKKFGRLRLNKNDPRTLDIDIIDFNSRKIKIKNKIVSLQIPHSSLEKRLFVLMPLIELKSSWKNPESGRLIVQLLSKISRLGDNKITKL